MRTRYTEKSLRMDVAEMNKLLAGAGSDKRFEVSPRNGYQAVDQYPVDENGQRIGTGVDFCVGAGGPKEVYCYAQQRMYEILSSIEVEKLKRENEKLKDMIKSMK